MLAGSKLGIVAGGGALPAAIAEAANASGRDIFVIAIESMANREWVGNYRHTWVALGEIGRALQLVKAEACSEVTFAGRVPRPSFSALKLDARGVLALPKLLAAARHGDDALLRTVLAIFQSEGIAVVGAAEVARSLLAPQGVLTRLGPDSQSQADGEFGWKVLGAMGALDIGQSAVICEGLTLAVEAAEGTDAMLARVATLPEPLRGTASARRGVFIKAAKPKQERRVDLPVVGLRTIELVAAAGLAGLVVESGATLLLSPQRVVEAANAAGLFVLGRVKDAAT